MPLTVTRAYLLPLSPVPSQPSQQKCIVKLLNITSLMREKQYLSVVLNLHFSFYEWTWKPFHIFEELYKLPFFCWVFCLSFAHFSIRCFSQCFISFFFLLIILLLHIIVLTANFKVHACICVHVLSPHSKLFSDVSWVSCSSTHFCHYLPRGSNRSHRLKVQITPPPSDVSLKSKLPSGLLTHQL